MSRKVWQGFYPVQIRTCSLMSCKVWHGFYPVQSCTCSLMSSKAWLGYTLFRAVLVLWCLGMFRFPSLLPTAGTAWSHPISIRDDSSCQCPLWHNIDTWWQRLEPPVMTMTRILDAGPRDVFCRDLCDTCHVVGTTGRRGHSHTVRFSLPVDWWL